MEIQFADERAAHPCDEKNKNDRSPLLRPVRALALSGALAAFTLSLSGCGGAGGSQDPDLIVPDYPIAYIKRSIPVDENGDPVEADAKQVFDFNPGATLYVRERAQASAVETDVTTRAFGAGALYDVRDVEISYDGTMLIFAMREPEPEVTPPTPPTWNLWVYDIPSNRLKRVLRDSADPEFGDDVAPHFLPDDRIIFSSNRQRQTLQNLADEGRANFRSAEESRNEHATSIHLINVDCSSFDSCEASQPGDVIQVTFNMSHDMDPSVVPSTGEVVFTRWDQAGGADAMSLYKMAPDGTEVQMLYGVHSHDTGTDGSEIQFLKPRQSPDGRILTIAAPFTGTNLGGSILSIDVDNYIDITQPTYANLGAGGPAQVPATVNNVRTDAMPSPGGRFLSFFPLYDNSNRALVAWSPCRLLENSVVVPCTDARLADPNAQEAQPFYGIYLYDLSNQTQVPLLIPDEGFWYTEVVAAQPITVPPVIGDKVPGSDFDQINTADATKGTGTLRIRSVYDFGDETFRRRFLTVPVPAGNTAVNTLEDLANPGVNVTPTADDRPARFLRIVKAVNLPTNQELRLAGTAFGRSRAQGMREIVGYVPIEPDGSVRVEVPANVPFMISVLDKAGRRIGERHDRWLQVRPGETLSCAGCHVHDDRTGIPDYPPPLLQHGRNNAVAPSINAGALSDGYTFPNSLAFGLTNTGDTMADARTRSDPVTRVPTADIIYQDVWTDPAAAGRTADTPFSYNYAALANLPPMDLPQCITYKTDLCRIIINYEKHIEPLWSADRGANTCTNCHSTRDAMNVLRVPMGQLNLDNSVQSLTDDPNNVTDHTKAYRELLFGDNQQELNGAGTLLQDIMVVIGQDMDGNDILAPVNQPASMSAAGARVSYFMEKMNNTELDAGRNLTGAVDHTGMLDEHELKLIAEWLDIGAQYFNDPYDPAVPLN